MKRTNTHFAIFCCLLIGLPLISHSQISIGLKGGMNLSSLKGANFNSIDFEYKTGYHGGVYGNIHLGKKIGIQSEILYSTQGGSVDDGLQAGDIDLNYLNVPLMLRYSGKSGFYLEAGPQFGFRTNEVDFGDFSGTVNQSDLSICGGVGYMGIFPFGAGLRYNLGLSKTGELDTSEVMGADLKNGVFQLSIYWQLFGK